MIKHLYIASAVAIAIFTLSKSEARPTTTALGCTTANYLDWQQAIKAGDVTALQNFAAGTTCLNERHRPNLLRYAALNSTFEIFEQLVNLGADVNSWTPQETDDECYYQALHAIQYLRPQDSFRFVQFLIDHGSDVRSVPYDAIIGKPTSGCHYDLPLAVSVERGDLQTFRLLADHNAVISGNELNANKSDNLEMAERLINMGADVNSHSLFTHQQTPLHITQSEAILRLLVAHGADLNLQDDRGETPIHSYFYTQMDLIRAAIDLGADLRIRDLGQRTPLLVWAEGYYWGWAPAYDYALEHSNKIDLNQGDAQGRTPLMLLSEVGWNRKHALIETIAKGADVNAKDNNGKSVLDYWINDADPETIQILRNAGAH